MSERLMSWLGSFAAALFTAHAGARWLGPLALVPLFGAFGTIDAQTDHGTIDGVVTDSAGAALQGATVRISGTDERRISGSAGKFRFERIIPGTRRLTATMIGATPAADSVVVRAGDTARVRFKLVVKPFVAETLPPRFARGTRPDTVPREVETIDLITRVGSLSRLRARSPSRGRRELRLWLGGPGIPQTLVRLLVEGERVDGQVIRYLDVAIPDRDADPRWRAFVDSVPSWLHRVFRCGPIETDTLHFPAAQAGFRDRLVAVCTTQYRHDVKWGELLRELEGHRVWTLPDASELPSIGNIVTNAGGVTVESWDGRRYHTYTYASPHPIAAPEAAEGDAIRRALIAFLRRNHEIPADTSVRR